MACDDGALETLRLAVVSDRIPSLLTLVRRAVSVAVTHGYRTVGPRPDGNPGGRNTERNPHCSGTCDRSRH